VRESIFNIIEHGALPIEGARILDLFAGCGTLGIEALSRGASFCLFVDDAAQSRAAIRRNLDDLGLIGRAKVFRRDAAKMGELSESGGAPYDYVFMDPPYGQKLIDPALKVCIEGGWLSRGAVMVLEMGAKDPQPAFDEVEYFDARVYGDTRIVFART
jgi:16S rRNA (guanine966-N2)-methyltransferase